jgi:outer membrane protease
MGPQTTRHIPEESNSSSHCDKNLEYHELLAVLLHIQILISNNFSINVYSNLTINSFEYAT